MARAPKQANRDHIEVGYEAKVVFTLEQKARVRAGVLEAWQRSQGLWSNHPVFHAFSIKQMIEWLRGEDEDTSLTEAD